MLVFEENGFPVELGSTREIERAIANGRLRADTIVKTGMNEGSPRTCRAAEVGFLRPLLGLSDPVAPTPPPPTPPVVPNRWVPPPSSPHAPNPPPPLSAAERQQFWRRQVTTESVEPEWVPPVILGYREPAGPLAALMPLRRWGELAGRSSRREFWSFQLLQLVAGFASNAYLSSTTAIVIALLLIIPNFSLVTRRFHDQNRSGWFILLGVIPYVGWLIVLVMMLVPGTVGRNRHGPDPHTGR